MSTRIARVLHTAGRRACSAVLMLALQTACVVNHQTLSAPGQAIPAVDWQDLWPHMEGVWTADGIRVWVIGEKGVVVHSRNQGASWVMQATGTVANLSAIFGAREGRQLVVVGQQGAILRSDDEGAHWGPVMVPVPGLDLHGVSGSRDGVRLWAVGAAGTVLLSNDHGQSWTRTPVQTKAVLHAVYASESGRQAWAVGDDGAVVHLTLSEAGGAPHATVSTAASVPLHAIVGSPDGSRLWAGGDGGVIVVADGGKWADDLAATSGESRSVDTVRGIFVDAKGSTVAVAENGIILQRTGEHAWQHVRSPTGKYLQAIHGAADGSQLWAAGGRGTVLHSALGGPWERVRPRDYLSLTKIVTSADGQRVAAIGAYEGQTRVVTSIDRGENWAAHELGPTLLKGLFASADGTRLWAVGERGALARSSNWGESWMTGTAGAGQDVFNTITGSIDGRDLWVGGEGGEIRQSRDGGTTWVRQRSGTGNIIFQLFRTPTGELWASTGAGVNIGSQMSILRSRDGGQNWTTAWEGRGAGLFGIFVSDDGRGIWAVGPRGSVVRSRDGGSTWTEKRDVTSDDLRAVCGDPDGHTVWVVGDRGAVAAFDSSRDDWAPQPQPTPDTLNAIVANRDRVWAAGEGGDIIRTVPSAALPATLAVRLSSNLTKIGVGFESAPSLADRARPDVIATLLIGHPTSPGGSNDYVDVPGTSSRLINGEAWRFEEFDPGTQLGMQPGGSLDLKIRFETPGMRRDYFVPTITYDRWRLVRENPGLIASAGAVVSLLLLFTGLLIVQPLWLIALYRAAVIYQAVDKIPFPAVSGPTKAFLKASALPYFVQHPRALDAWVRAHLDLLKASYLAERVVAASEAYVPLPVQLDEVDGAPGGEVIDKPTVEFFAGWFSAGRQVALDIVASGGAGKTTLAIQLGRWALDGRLAAHPVIPLLIDQDTDNVVSVVKSKLQRSIQNTADLPLDFVVALLKHKRVLLIVDRLSERSTQTRKHVESLGPSSPVAALVVTSRIDSRLERAVLKRLRPQPLDSGALLHFVTALMDRRTFGTLAAQIDLGQRIARMIQIGQREMPITPLLARLYVTKAVAFAQQGVALDDLPRSIPAAYFEYLCDVNPDTETVSHRMRDDEMLRASEVIAEVLLGRTFVPQEALRSDIRARLLGSGWPDPGRLDPVQRLIDNGVMTERPVATDSFVRFILDPISEYLGALAFAKDCGADVNQWRSFVRDVQDNREAVGFRTALAVIVHTYGQQFGWPVAVDGDGNIDVRTA